MTVLDENCPLRRWARPHGGDSISDDALVELWGRVLDRVKFQKEVEKISQAGGT